MSDANARLLAAHASGDTAQLVALYRDAARAADTEDQAGFYLTFAYVFALESGHPDIEAIRSELIAMGREE